MSVITLNIPKKLQNIDPEELKNQLQLILEDYTEFDLHLLEKHNKIKDLPADRFVNL